MGRGPFVGATRVDTVVDTVDVSNRAGREAGKVRQEDETGALLAVTQAADVATTSGTNAVVSAGATRRAAVAWDVAVNGTIRIEVSADGGTNWYAYKEVAATGGTPDATEVTGFADVRARAVAVDFADADVTSIAVGARGL